MKKIPWVIKYRPKRLEDVIDQEEAKRLLLDWIRSWLEGKPKEKAVLLYGPPGCGKTSLIESIANEFKLELIEMNASDYRRKSDLDRIARVAALQRGLRSRYKLILLDEVDGISGTADIGGLETILDIVKVTTNPIAMTANDPWDPKLRPLRDVVLMVEFRRLSKTDIRKVLSRVCTSERLVCDEGALDLIAERAEGDLRSAINDLEAVAEGYGRVSVDLAKNLLRPRDREYEPFEVVRRIFISKYAWQAKQAAQQTDLTPDELIQWINENLPRQISDPEDLWRAYEALSRADVYMGRVVRSGSWDLLPYAIEMMSAGISLAIVNDLKSKFRWVKYGFPQKVLLMARTREVRQLRDDLAGLIAKHVRTSKAVVKSEVLPYVKIIFDHNPMMAARMALALNLPEDMIRFISPQNSGRILEILNKLKTGQDVKAKKPEAGKADRSKGRKSGSLNTFTLGKRR